MHMFNFFARPNIIILLIIIDGNMVTVSFIFGLEEVLAVSFR